MTSGYNTASQQTPHRYEEVLLRRHPHLSWRDSGGAHSLVVDRLMVLGAAPGVDVVIAEPTVSRIHAELEPRDTGLWVRDLGSRNGTFVEDVRAECACVPERGRVRVGAIELTVSYAPQPTAVPLWSEPKFGPLVGAAAPMRELFVRLARVACSEATVLIQGETGTGKELVARALHDASPRAEGPFVVVDCGALPETLLDAELFGHSRGAFTGATAARHGSFEAAEGGTIFLDEIGELPVALQPKLLRVLEARTVRRLGENEGRPVNVRFISATHRDLRTMVNARAFREDLYFRLAVLPVTIPPLRERPSDIRVLVEHFLPAEQRASFTEELARELESRPWLGNVRELRNFVERLTTLGPTEALAATSGVKGDAFSPGADPGPSSKGTGEGGLPGRLLTPELLALPFREGRERCTNQIEREYLEALLERHGYNVTSAAQSAGLARTYLHRLIRKHRI